MINCLFKFIAVSHILLAMSWVSSSSPNNSLATLCRRYIQTVTIALPPDSSPDCLSLSINAGSVVIVSFFSHCGWHLQIRSQGHN